MIARLIGTVTVGILLCCGCDYAAPDFVNAPQINTENVWNYTQAIASIFPRHAGTQTHRKAVELIRLHAEKGGAKVMLDHWNEYTPFGKAPFVNIIAEVPGQNQKEFIVVGSHYDTKQISHFVGANDGASSTGTLIAMIEALKNNPPPVTVRFVFFDGEECFFQYGDGDGLHGSKRYAKQLLERGEVKKCRAMILLDMIGDKDLCLTLPLDTPPTLADAVKQCAASLDGADKVRFWHSAVLDDHVPFQDLGIPSVNLIDFEFGPHNIYWHTTEDTIEKLSPESMRFVGNLAMRLIWKIAANPQKYKTF